MDEEKDRWLKTAPADGAWLEMEMAGGGRRIWRVLG